MRDPATALTRYESIVCRERLSVEKRKYRRDVDGLDTRARPAISVLRWTWVAVCFLQAPSLPWRPAMPLCIGRTDGWAGLRCCMIGVREPAACRMLMSMYSGPSRPSLDTCALASSGTWRSYGVLNLMASSAGQVFSVRACPHRVTRPASTPATGTAAPTRSPCTSSRQAARFTTFRVRGSRLRKSPTLPLR